MIKKFTATHGDAVVLDDVCLKNRDVNEVQGLFYLSWSRSIS